MLKWADCFAGLPRFWTTRNQGFTSRYGRCRMQASYSAPRLMDSGVTGKRTLTARWRGRGRRSGDRRGTVAKLPKLGNVETVHGNVLEREHSMIRTNGLRAGLLIVLGALALVATREVRSGEACCAGKGAVGAAGLEAIKQLAGTWMLVGGDGKPTDQVASRFRVTSAGSAVEETLFPGSDHEMVTMYHLDGESLMLTHYCALGNQPRMKAEASDDPKKITFKFAGATNLKSENDMHMHEGTITLLEPNRIKAEWQLYDGGKNTGAHKMEMMRN